MHARIRRWRRKIRQSNQGGLVINGWPTKEANPGVQTFPVSINKPVATVSVPAERGSSATSTAAALYLLHSEL